MIRSMVYCGFLPSFLPSILRLLAPWSCYFWLLFCKIVEEGILPTALLRRVKWFSFLYWSSDSCCIVFFRYGNYHIVSWLLTICNKHDPKTLHFTWDLPFQNRVMQYQWNYVLWKTYRSLVWNKQMFNTAATSSQLNWVVISLFEPIG